MIPPLLLSFMLFIIYLNDLPSVIHSCNVLCYADDTAIYVSGPDCVTVRDDLQEDLSRVAF